MLGAIAGAMAVGALASGFLARRISLRVLTLVGLAVSAGGLAWMSTWSRGRAHRRLRRVGRRLRPGLWADRHSALDGRRGSGRPRRLRCRLGDRDRGQDDRDGRRHGRADGLRLHYDHADLQRDLRRGRRLQAVRPRLSARSLDQRRSGGPGPGAMGGLARRPRSWWASSWSPRSSRPSRWCRP